MEGFVRVSDRRCGFALDMVFADILVFCGILLYDVVGELNVGVLNFEVNALK